MKDKKEGQEGRREKRQDSKQNQAAGSGEKGGKNQAEHNSSFLAKN